MTPAQFLEFLDLGSRRVFSIYPKGLHYPSPVRFQSLCEQAWNKGKSVAVIVDRAKPVPADWTPELLECGVHRTWGARGGDIECVTVLRAEGDGPDGLEPEPWLRFGLPAPNVVVETGGRSQHLYWRLPEPVPPAVGKALHKRLHDHIDSQFPTWGCDHNVGALARPMRMVGSRHPRTGGLCVATEQHLVRHDLAELLPQTTGGFLSTGNTTRREAPSPAAVGFRSTKSGCWATDFCQRQPQRGVRLVESWLAAIGPLGPAGSNTWSNERLQVVDGLTTFYGQTAALQILADCGWDLGRLEVMAKYTNGTKQSGAGLPKVLSIARQNGWQYRLPE